MPLRQGDFQFAVVPKKKSVCQFAGKLKSAANWTLGVAPNLLHLLSLPFAVTVLANSANCQLVQFAVVSPLL